MATDKSDYQRIFATAFTKAEELLENAEKKDTVLSQYLDSWLEIAEMTTELDNFALQDVILLFIEYCSDVFNSAESLTDEHWLLLKKWETSFEDYIKSPDNIQTANVLIQCLKEPLLAVESKLSTADEKMLLDNFTLVAKQLDNATQKNSVESDNLIWNELALLFDEAVLSLQNIWIQQAINDEQAFSESLKLYLQSWKSITEVIESHQEEESWNSLLDIVLLFIEINTQAFNQNEALNNDQQNVLNRWHNLFNSYLKVQGSQQITVALIKCLSDSVWSDAISVEDEALLLKNIGVVTEEPKKNNLPQTEVKVSNVKTIEKTNIWQQLEPFLNTATRILKDITTGNQKLILEYKNNWENIAQTIEKHSEYQGLLDIVQLFIEISIPVFEESIILDEKQQVVLNKWHNLFSSYLKAHGNKTLAMSLVRCLSDKAWPDAITVEDEKELLQSFEKKAQVVKEQIPSQKAELLVDANKLDSQQNSKEKEPLIAVSSSESLSVWQKLKQPLQDSAQYLKIAENKQIAKELQAFKENLQLYTDNWQQIADIIETDSQQTALLEIVLLFNDISSDVVENQNDLTSEQLALLNKWQSLFSEYIENINNLQLIESLLDCLCHSAWTNRIYEEDKSLLLNAFCDDDKTESHFKYAQELKFIDDDSTKIFEQDLTEEQANVWKKIRPIFEQAATELKAIIDIQIEEHTDSLNRNVQAYIQCWQQIVDILEKNKKQPGLMDVVLLFTEICIPAFDELNSNHLSLLNKWHHLFDDYLKAEGHREIAKALVNCLVEPFWPEALTEKDAQMLLAGFTTDDDKRLTVASDLEQQFIANTPVSKEYHPIWDDIQSFFDDSKIQIENIAAAINAGNVQAYAEYLQQYASYWLIIAEVISDENNDELLILADVCNLFTDNCTELTEQPMYSSDELSSLLYGWHDAFKIYLQNIGETKLLLSFIQILENPLWVRPLTEEDSAFLLNLVTSEDEEKLVFLDDDSEDLLMFNDDLFANESEEMINESSMFAQETLTKDESEQWFTEEEQEELIVEEAITEEEEQEELIVEEAIT